MTDKHPAAAAPPLSRWLAIAALVVILDQLTKWLVTRHYALGEGTPITPFFNLVHARNTGAAFSFLAGAGGWQRWLFTALALGAAVFIVVLLRRYAGEKLFCFSLGLILGGAIGNVIDRMRHGWVVDFLDFHWRFLDAIFFRGHFPAFNVADSAITIGAIGLILNELLRWRKGG